MYDSRVVDLKTETDEHVATRVQAGEREAFGILVERYEPKLLRYGRRFLSNALDVEDIVQDVFVSAYENFKGFDTSQRFSPWIYRIAHNAFVNALRKHSREPLTFFDFDTLVSHAVYDDPSEREREQAEMRKLLDKNLAEIGSKYREVLILYYLEDLDYKEIADVLHIPIGTVGVRLRRGREALKKQYER